MPHYLPPQRHRPLFVALLALMLPGATYANDKTIEVARTGGNAGAVDVFFNSFLPPSVNNVGSVVYNARLNGAGTSVATDSGIYRYQLTDVNLAVIKKFDEIAREDDTLDVGGNPLRADSLLLTTGYLQDVQFGGMIAPVVGTFNRVAFELPVRSGLARGNTAIVVERSANFAGDSLDLAAAEGEDVPNGDGSFADLGGLNLFGVGQNGEVGFFSALNGTSAGAANNTAIYRYTSQHGIREIVREGDSVGGLNLSGVFSPQMNTHGGMVFLGGLAGANVLADSSVYLVSNDGIGGSSIASEGDAVPDGDGVFAEFSNLRINNDSDIAFSALLRNTDGLPGTPFAGNSAVDDSGIYLRRANGETIELAREGKLVPSGDARFGRFADAFSGDVPRLALNDHEEVAFRVEVFDTGHEEFASGIYIASPDHIQHVVRTGEGYEGGILASFEHPALNNVGLTAFIAELNVGEIQSDEGEQPLLRKLLMIANGDERATVVRQGDTINGQVVFDFVFNNDPRGQTNGFSDTGLLAYEVTYESGLHAINAWAPELTLHLPIGDPNQEMAWDEDANWRFGLTPSLVHDVALNADTNATLRGPDTDTTVRSLSLGHGGSLRLILGAGGFGTAEGLTIGANGTVEGGGTLNGPVSNNGLIAVSPGMALNARGELLNRSEISVGLDGVFTISGSYFGDGHISGPGLTRVTGLLSPGSVVEIGGDVTLEASSQTLLELGGPRLGAEYDSLQVGGTMALGGRLTVELTDGFAPTPGMSFLLLEAALIEGSFALLHLPSIEGLRFVLSEDATSLRLNVQAVPLPAALWLTMGACGVLATRRRTRPDP